jgi:hypothetical protein
MAHRNIVVNRMLQVAFEFGFQHTPSPCLGINLTNPANGDQLIIGTRGGFHYNNGTTGGYGDCSEKARRQDEVLRKVLQERKDGIR